MIISKDGYCPKCHEGDVSPTGYLGSVHFFKCNRCSEHYGFKIDSTNIHTIGNLPFKIEYQENI